MHSLIQKKLLPCNELASKLLSAGSDLFVVSMTLISASYMQTFPYHQLCLGQSGRAHNKLTNFNDTLGYCLCGACFENGSAHFSHTLPSFVISFYSYTLIDMIQ